ncbi:hypothetical protein [Streptomyces sp. NBC_00576]|uniref:hypothetical protein n=1 Tax=Streptomyces sp. NBC_00576 TaxID=2903665 RepID=UPI002E8208E4|nr:hypothetical protein [Streptomyces sp. NBC_00576]WUB74906.1 hypothetical protein OG734_35340 [Streptomyces sp. NBC_00576]
MRKVMRRARIEAYVRRAEPLNRDRHMLSNWRVVSTDHRHFDGRPRWRRFLMRRAVLLGRYDIDGIVSGTPRQALRLARAEPFGRDAPAAVAVRPLDGRWRESVRYWREEEFEHRLFRLVFGAFLPAAAIVFAFGAIGLAQCFWILVACLGAYRTARAGWELYREGRPADVGLALLLVLVFTVMGLGVFDSDGTGWTPEQIVVTVTVIGVIAGLRLLVRQWSWGEWVAWVVPLVATVAISSFVAAGSVLHALYADGLSLSPDDLGVPPIWQVLAGGKLLMMFSLVMVLPAWWGFARHRHHGYAAPGDGFNIVLYVFVLLLMLGGATLQALQSAKAAVNLTVEAVARGEGPPSYFGVEPAWMCVQPVVELDRLSGEGPPLHPRTPYLSFGTSGNNAVLWDRSAASPVKIPASRIWLKPAESGTAPCAVSDVQSEKR